MDILVNNAGIGDMIAIDETSDEDVAKVMDINFHGQLSYIREALKIFWLKINIVLSILHLLFGLVLYFEQPMRPQNEHSIH